VEKLFLEPESIWGDLEKVIFYQDEPFGGLSIVAHYKILEFIKKSTKVKVLLSGQGGDESLCGYSKFFFFYLKDELKKAHFLNVFKNIFFSFFYRTVLWQFSLSEGKRYLPIFQKYDPFNDVLRIKRKLEPIWESKNLRERQILDITQYSIPSLIRCEQRNAMSFSLEIRLPFLDYRFVNFSLNLSPNLKIKNGWMKYILRKSIKELPESIAWRRDKQGFIIPEEKWLKHNFKERIMDLFKESRLDQIGIINKNKFLECYQKFLKGDKRIWCSDITRFLIAELWIRNLLKM
jgi:asparagine synthase (glutamine-hydrolysing)